MEKCSVDYLTSMYSTSNLNFDNSILFYLANFLFYSILFYSVFSILYSILYCCTILYYALFCILFYNVFYSILFYLARYSILFYFVFCSVNSIMQTPKFFEYFLPSLILTFYWLICTYKINKSSFYLRNVFNDFVFYWGIIWFGAVHTLSTAKRIIKKCAPPQTILYLNKIQNY